MINFALAGILGDKVPQVTDFGLSDPVNASETLFRPNNSLRASPGFGLIAGRHISQ